MVQLVVNVSVTLHLTSICSRSCRARYMYESLTLNSGCGLCRCLICSDERVICWIPHRPLAGRSPIWWGQPCSNRMTSPIMEVCPDWAHWGHTDYPPSRIVVPHYDNLPFTTNVPQIARFMGPTWGPPGSCRPQMGPMLAPRTLLSRVIYDGHCQAKITNPCLRPLKINTAIPERL